jgi:hypothetical protein
VTERDKAWAEYCEASADLKPRSPYRPWLRNVHVRRAWMLVALPVAIPAACLYEGFRSLLESWPEIKDTWQRHPSEDRHG